MLIDSHAHLDDEKFEADRKYLIENLEKNGIELVVNIGADMESSRASVNLADTYDNIYAVVGVHPHSAKEITESSLKEIENLAKNKKVVAIGEIGLDYHYDNSPRDIQKKWFKKQILLAKRLDMPIVVHTREADEDTIEILKEEREGLRGVIHCFSSDRAQLKEYLNLGFFIALGGPVTFKKTDELKEVAKIIPIEKLLVETDAPYLAPHPYRGKRNEPMFVKQTANLIAELKGMTIEDLALQTNKNTKEIFNIK
ncbi:TatD family hydrolase [Tissierella creatinophila]|uniref:Putative deoxyribonuclease YcfH n=1 Tax=Tissierella creatinophila DSM 6911 TaxID=1123403 RepID=A0A1U7M4Z6_TISCR|nr:TatD family hydrolase [Tissierella creatinophila]OLS02289.1 putative deoxyribonuclease YcfH [Tissierella creatinophila DSM 6911]